MRKLFLLLLLALVLMAVTVGCNTLRGAGTDIKNTGKAVEDIAD